MSQLFRPSAVLLSAGCVALGLLAGCSSPTDPPPVACTHSTVFTSRRQIPANTKDLQTFTIPATGSLDVTVDWTFAGSVMSAVLAQAPCSIEQLQSSSCNVIFSAFSPPKPITDATSLRRSGGGYSLIISNLTSFPETVSVQVTLTSAGCSTD